MDDVRWMMADGRWKMGLCTALFAIHCLLFTSCTKEGDTIYKPTPGEKQPATTPLVTVIYGPNSLGDRSYCDLIYKGVEAAAKQYGVRTLQLAPESEAQGLVYLETMFSQMEKATDTVRRLFITPSPVYDAFIRKNNNRLEKNPYADLLYMETSTPLEGKGSTFYIDYYGAMYMGGCMAHYGVSDLLTVLLANPYTQTVREAGEGFLAGYNDSPHWNDRFPVQLHVRYLSDEPVGGFTMADTTAMRIYQEEKHYFSEEKDNNVTFVPICGGAMHAIFRALHTNSLLYDYDCYVGIDGDMCYDNESCLFSVVKHIDKVMVDYIGLWLKESMPKHQTLGLADGATGTIREGYQYAGANGYEYFKKRVDLDSLRQVAIRKEVERYEK
ncbi:MAG: hypothetical protein IIT33_07590 [Prevotella sp.]|nr:hypothetical protein [Prevotella sp.]